MPEISEPIFDEWVGNAYDIDPQGPPKKGTRRAGKPSDNKTPLLFGMEEQQVLKPKPHIKPGDLAKELSGPVESRRKKRNIHIEGRTNEN